MNLAEAEILAYEAASRDAELDDILIRWHHWQQGSKVGRGYNSRALVVGEYRISRQYDDVSGVLDDDLDAIRSEQVDFEVSEMADPYRTAIYLLARNLTTGRSVWASPRLPVDPLERGAIVVRARCMVTTRLVAAGVMAENVL